MDSKLAPLCLGSPARFRDRWQGHLAAFEVAEDWEVLNLVIARGPLRTSSVKLPFSQASDWSGDHISFDITSEAAFGRQVPPLAAPGRRLSAKTPLSIEGVRLLGALVERAERRLRWLLIRPGRMLSQERKAAVEQISLEGDLIRLAVQLEQLPIYRSDEDMQALVKEALTRHPYLTADDRRATTVKVSDGIVALVGNVRTAQAKAWAEEAAASVDGSVTLRNEIVDDIHLEMALAQALAREERFRTAQVYPRSSLGQVTLLGQAPSASMVEEIVRVAARVPGVRSLTNRLEVPGE